jgi:hypothetical protein
VPAPDVGPFQSICIHTCPLRLYEVFHWYNSCPQVPFTQAIHWKRYRSTLFTDILATVHTFHKPQLRFWDFHSRAPERSHCHTRARRAPLGGCTLPSAPQPNVPPRTRSQRARIGAPVALQSRLCHAPQPGHQAGRARSHGRALRRASGSGLELGGLTCGRGRRSRSLSGRGSNFTA